MYQNINLKPGVAACIDCLWHEQSTLAELEAIPANGACKHLDPEYWYNQGWQRNWGDAAIMALPHMEILRKETPENIKYLILNRFLRRPVEIYFDKKSQTSWGSF